MTPAQKERIEELAALCAAGAASASERAELETVASDNPWVRAMVREYTDAASLLAASLPPLRPPPGALDGIRRRLGPDAGFGGVPGAPPVMPGPSADVIPIASRRRAPAVAAAVILPLAAAAAFAIFWWQEREKASSLGQRVAELQTENENERRVRTRSERTVAELNRQVVELQGTMDTFKKFTKPEVKLATMTSEKGEVLKVLLDPMTGAWYVLAFKLPEQAADKDYQLWFLDKKQGGKPVPSVVLQPGPSGALQALIDVPAGVDPAGAAVSLEPKGGSPTGNPTQVVMGGLL